MLAALVMGLTPWAAGFLVQWLHPELPPQAAWFTAGIVTMAVWTISSLLLGIFASAWASRTPLSGPPRTLHSTANVGAVSVVSLSAVQMEGEIRRLVAERDDQKAKLLPLMALAQQVSSIATNRTLPDGGAVDTPTLLWAERWGPHISRPAEAEIRSASADAR